MAPAFSYLQGVRPILPSDILHAIACLVDIPSRRALLLSCRECHYIVARVLYRSVQVVAPAPDPTDGLYLDHTPFRLLSNIVESMLPKGSLLPRVNAQYMVTFTYATYGYRADLRAAPLLGEVLRAAVRLRHLRLDVANDAVDIVLDALRRSEVIVTPSATLITVPSRPHIRLLPCLESIRSTRVAIIEALMRYRAVHTVVAELNLTEDTIAKFLRPIPAWNPVTLRRLAMTFHSHDIRQFVIAVGAAFPCLEHLSLQVTPSSIAGYKHSAVSAR